ncbi:unnamed protein product [Owenia fusiformis]|uniref:Neutral ceramidase n=1 Tax=Owenia fusiformis TaxID=6347 RepID=A0A8S4N3J3_OWEFU|nr:unnamed protein product [Owenia fusiformis]
MHLKLYQVLSLLVAAGVVRTQTQYFVGVGIADVTGPAAEIPLYGYADPGQTAKGIHTRQYSRAFIITDSSDASGKRVVFVSIDNTMVSTILKQAVAERLVQLYPDLYNNDNVMLSSTHTHSTPGGFLGYTMYNIPQAGFAHETFNILVNGIVASVQRAHANIRPANLLIAEDELLDASSNRSPYAYEQNPAGERARYTHDTDKQFAVLKIVDMAGNDMGIINWFAVHTTAMNKTNHLISADTKGYASYLFERDFNNEGREDPPFVAAFAQANEGDISPNTAGVRCLQTGGECDYQTSQCPTDGDQCVGIGIGTDMFDTTKIIGERQYNKAKEMYPSIERRVTGSVDFRHQWVDMSDQQLSGGRNTCPPCMGYSFAAGATDGPGATDIFHQGDTEGDLLIDGIRDAIFGETEETTIDCQEPKPILLATGQYDTPLPWQPSIVPVQIFKVGDLIISSLPSEVTTMAGRRVKEAVKNTLVAEGYPSNLMSVFTGLANTYSSYTVTFEEYQVQRYEGASTIFGPHTLEAYINKLNELATSMARGLAVSPGPSPPDLRGQVPENPDQPAQWDEPVSARSYGEVLIQPTNSYNQGTTVSVTFVTANPRHDLMTDNTFLRVEQNVNEAWQTVFTDRDWETRFYWDRECNGIPCTDDDTPERTSIARITWDIPSNQAPGNYRISHYGHHKTELDQVVAFTGTSNIFTVNANKDAEKSGTKEEPGTKAPMSLKPVTGGLEGNSGVRHGASILLCIFMLLKQLI